jgi:D-serine deaminase-like pyridoxal phosphate-dependent protein
MRLSDLPTPALLLDLDRLRRNAAFGLRRARELGVALRPHMKTTKSRQVAQLAIDPDFGGIAVSTLKEAEHFAEAGIADIQLALCMPPGRIDQALALAARIPRFSVFVDDLDMVDELVRRAAGARQPLGVWIEIDSGEHRTGVAPQGALLPELARRIAGAQGLRLAGVATHAGQSYDARSVAAVAAVAEDERRAVTAAAERLRAEGLECHGVSAGSTPGLAHARSGAGLTEYRAGVYLLGDLFQAGLGSLDTDAIAVSVLTSVIARSEAPRRFMVDAGGLALSKDRGTAALPGHDRGYGVLCGLDDGAAAAPADGALQVADVAQEHGFVPVPEAAPLPALGQRFRVLPNHACMTAAMYDRYVVHDGQTVLGTWPRINGWG